MPNFSPSVTEDHLPSNSEQRVGALQSIEELAGLTLEELRWIADAGTERFVQDGELIFSQGAVAFDTSPQGSVFYVRLPACVN